MRKVCDYVYTKLGNVMCGRTNEELGDIQGYSGRQCYTCKYRRRNNTNTELLLIKYRDAELETIGQVKGCDWIDLRVAEDTHLKSGEFKLIHLGVSIALPAGYEALVIPRSSTFMKYGILQANSVGLIDETYCGDNDEWMFPAYATREIAIPKNTRICQFRLFKHQPQVMFIEIDHLSDEDRGGFGSSGER